jgi:hypothetical protein
MSSSGETPEPIVLVIFNPKSTRAFGQEKHEVARAGGFVKFGTFSQKPRFFIDYHSELVLQTAQGVPRAFKSTR